jgi:ATP-dependent DNA ligase
MRARRCFASSKTGRALRGVAVAIGPIGRKGDGNFTSGRDCVHCGWQRSMAADRMTRPENSLTPFPTHLELAVLSAHCAAFSRPGWLVELKVDWYRALALRGNALVTVVSHNGNSLATSFPEVRAALDRLPPGTALDGELVIRRHDGAGL